MFDYLNEKLRHPKGATFGGDPSLYQRIAQRARAALHLRSQSMLVRRCLSGGRPIFDVRKVLRIASDNLAYRRQLRSKRSCRCPLLPITTTQRMQRCGISASIRSDKLLYRREAINKSDIALTLPTSHALCLLSGQERTSKMSVMSLLTQKGQIQCLQLRFAGTGRRCSLSLRFSPTRNSIVHSSLIGQY